MGRPPSCRIAIPAAFSPPSATAANTLLATFTYDADGRPSSVQVGSDPASAPRYYYLYNGHGDVVSLVDTSGTAVATYAYDEQTGDFGVTSTTEYFSNGWHNHR